ncbi:hypothetical protein [Zunongwangia pacifica]|uniref:DUF1735 domain-containing protein n=1 Tax=Zunongwangia pacifica TaxID=2911062 RepID=A0A9X1ZMW3_9FLAO|nr:hypothetical protein [Zunongwangia pacifica]MCL6217692.1 hypothetical protein [Zunongwangia pacifica]
MTRFYAKRMAYFAVLLFLLTACDSDDDFMIDTDAEKVPEPPEEIEPVGYLAPLQLPDTIKLTYGEDFRGELPNEYQSMNVSFELQFHNENIEITSEKNLQKVLGMGIYIDAATNQLMVDSQELYPNNFSSSITGKRLPDAYKVTLTASSSPMYLPVSKTFFIKIAPARIQIEEMDNSMVIPFAYQMYKDSEAIAYHLSAPALNLENTQWQLHQNGRPDEKVILQENAVSFAENPGDPAQEAEWTYDLIASLERDGYALATRQFRVRFIPEIKFLYGMYYADLDLTILTNRLQIALHQDYQSPAPQIYPEKYKKSFSILSIEKDGTAFNNEENIITIDPETGRIKVAHNHSLTQGEYLIKVEAQTTTGLSFETNLTLVMSQPSEDDHEH